MSQLNSVWVFSDNPERYAELFGGAQQWGQQVYAIVQINKEALIRDLKINKIIEDDEIKEKTPQDNITPKRKLGY